MGHRVVSLSPGFWACFGPFSSLLTCFYFSIPLDPQGPNDFQLKLHFPLYVVWGWAGSSLLLCPPEPLISGSYLILITKHWGSTNILLIFENTELKFGALVTWSGTQSEWPRFKSRLVWFLGPHTHRKFTSCATQSSVIVLVFLLK